MNHKRGRPKNRRAGCLMCKPHKANGAGSRATSKLGLRGFSKIRASVHSLHDLLENC